MSNSPLLIFKFIAPPGSGKSTFSTNLATRIPALVANSDPLRIAMWGSHEAAQAAHATPAKKIANNKLTFGAMNYITERALAAGMHMIYDCNANKKSDRQDILGIAKKYNARIIVVAINTPRDIAIQRILTRTYDWDRPAFTHNEAVELFDDFRAQIEPPTEDETSVMIDGTERFDQQFTSLKKQLEVLSIHLT